MVWLHVATDKFERGEAKFLVEVTKEWDPSDPDG